MLARLIPLALIALAACNGGSAAPMPDGPASLGVIAGNNQVVPAAPSARLPDPVVAQAVRLPNGQVGFRVLDAVDLLLPPKAYAQTTVNGIPNLVVCVTAPVGGGRAMKAEVPCATTDAAGKATFVFLTDSVAGKTKGIIAAALATGTKVTDSVTATVVAGAVNPNYRGDGITIRPLPATVPENSVQDVYGNAIPFRIIAKDSLVVQDTTVGSIGARTIVSGRIDGVDRIVELRGAGNVLLGRARYSIIAGPNLGTWRTAGLNTSP